MREIIFRGKRIDTGEWVYGDIIQWKDGSVDIAPIESDCGQYPVYPETIGQYTGLKDRTDKCCIYEGDIVKAPLLDPIFGDIISGAFDNVAISFHNGSFVVAYYEGRHKIYLQDLYDKIEVLGNIHDNPELLEDEK